ncbi:MAG: hypothetical protein FWB96_07875 [Defluviitaleaceae bacterium]|nr:hypothetical protein [Defluviitaleaceae bacterium]MCL2262906.1 hypothetical protein [Defluviitaleaceae bacterium]
MATYKDIQAYIKERHGYLARGTWIAHMKEICGLNPARAINRRSCAKRINPCPPHRQNDIRQAFIHFKLIEEEK